jgi:hypothetical protein
MEGHVLGVAAEDHEVRGVVVRPILVVVMHNLSGLQRPSQHLLRDQAMFVDVSVVHGERVSGKVDADVSILADVATALPPLASLAGSPLDGAILGAVLPLFGRPRQKGFSAPFASVRRFLPLEVGLGFGRPSPSRRTSTCPRAVQSLCRAYRGKLLGAMKARCQSGFLSFFSYFAVVQV